MNDNFFVPWNSRSIRKVPKLTMELYAIGGKRPCRLVSDGLHAAKKPFLSILSPEGTIRMFLSALKKNAFDEASSYISRQYFGNADMEELSKLLQGTKGYQCYFNLQNEQTVSVALSVEGRMDIVSMDIVEEPNTFGKWKIWRIVKE